MSKREIMDGCTAAAHVAFALSDVATIYPITPIASMGDTAVKWGLQGRKNLMGQALDVQEMESELGAAGATHGALAAGALATTFTSSQGLMLMIPNMYKISGELLPAVFHVGCRSLATHALSIFGDHQDVMACRATGFAMLASASVQETMDLALVAHLAAIDGRVPVLHIMDGWRTSNEMASIEVIDYEQMRPLVNWDNVEAFRKRGMNPRHPDLRGSAQNSDVYFQNREAANSYYNRFPSVVQEAMNRVAAITGRQYQLFDYYGAADADRVVIAIGTSTKVLAETVAYLNKRGEKTGVVSVHLYRPFDATALLSVIPPTVKAIAVLDRTKEPGAGGEPLFKDVVTAMAVGGRGDVKVIGGRYGLASKDFNPSMAIAVFDELSLAEPKREFTIGIDDDVTNLSLVVNQSVDTTPADVVQAQFYGFGSDGTVGATKQAATVINDTSGFYTQAFFNYSAKKSGGYTISQLRYSANPIESEFNIINADYIGCHKDTYVNRYDLLENIKPGGTFVLNSRWNTVEEMGAALPAAMKRKIARLKLKVYNIDAAAIAASVNLGARINTIMEAVFFHLAPGIDYDQAIEHFKQIVSTTYSHEGGEVVANNLAAIDKAIGAVTPIDYPSEWADAADEPQPAESLPDFVAKIARPCNALEGDKLPVSLFNPDGTMPMGTTAYEHRRVAINIPHWNPATCIECTECSLVCSHAAIRPVVLTQAEKDSAPADFLTKPAHGNLAGNFFRIQVYPDDCTGCASCATVCPGHALSMVPLQQDRDAQVKLLEYTQQKVTLKDNLLSRFTVQGSQLQKPLFEFSGACGGCGETPYIKLLTQLFGSRLIIANATGCSSIYGADFPGNPWTVNAKGHGPAWGNSLFEDNAEFGFGIATAIEQQRDRLVTAAKNLSDTQGVDLTLKAALDSWLDSKDDLDKSQQAADALLPLLAEMADNTDAKTLSQGADLLGAKSIWAIGGDGWAYDIGFAGLDHVLASGKNINILVMDTECYSNTGGQMSKATPLSAVAKYAPDGKRTVKKDLGRMMMTYGTVYVASISLGGNFQQAINALREAEAYQGPSIVIAYCPCINHGLRTGMSHSIIQERDAVKTGYWNLYRFNPSAQPQLTVDQAAPVADNFLPFINREDRYADLKMVDPTEAAVLQPRLRDHALSVYNLLTASINLKQ